MANSKSVSREGEVDGELAIEQPLVSQTWHCNEIATLNYPILHERVDRHQQRPQVFTDHPPRGLAER
jgi:hypothetical protein